MVLRIWAGTASGAPASAAAVAAVNGAQHPGERQRKREEDGSARGPEADRENKAETGDAEPRGLPAHAEWGAESFHRRLRLDVRQGERAGLTNAKFSTLRG